LQRKNAASPMDNLNYSYLNIAGAPSNRLGHVDDLVNSATFTDDIDDQNPNNYSYDQLGQLIGDQQELIANIEWRSGDKKINDNISSKLQSKNRIINTRFTSSFEKKELRKILIKKSLLIFFFLKFHME